MVKLLTFHRRRCSSKHSSIQVFSKEEEEEEKDMLEDYLIQSSKMQYGVFHKQVRELKYLCALSLNIFFFKAVKNTNVPEFIG